MNVMPPASRRAPPAAWLPGVALPLLALCALVAGIEDGAVATFDRALLLLLHAHGGPLADFAAIVVSASVTAVGVLMLALLLWRRQWQSVLLLLLASGGAALLESLVKHALQRPRPAYWAAIAHQSGFGLPSGHAMQSMIVALVLLVLLQRAHHARWTRTAAAAGAVFVLLAGIARVYLGAHYPTDVVAGWVLSFAWVNLLLAASGWAAALRR